MGIMKNLEKMHVAVVLDKFNGSPAAIGQQLSRHAIEAMMAGFGSPQWKKYMALFADNPDQLRRLTEVTDGDEAYFTESRAYIVANAVCGAGTTGQTGQTVTTGFGDAPVGVPAAQFDAVDAQFIATRPFVVPEPE
jgi:hypothetical protein